MLASLRPTLARKESAGAGNKCRAAWRVCSISAAIRSLCVSFSSDVETDWREAATIYSGDVIGSPRDHVTGTGYAPVGQTPMIRATGQRFGGFMISAITDRG